MHNSYQELSKKDKKIVRALIDKDIAEDFKRGMQHFDQLIQELKKSSDTPQDQYYKLFNEVRDFDKQIGRMYDRFTGSHFLTILANQILQTLVDETELNELSPEAKDQIISDVKFMRSIQSMNS
ncbi:hypothetical protein SNE26_13305 [Mucilaginibacter sp. cycad4]|uniref:hypothetical protein n=1 Tax=Mucilaginibacter sp. cycad4 TaxID=3342096 RepID=UPI002AABFDD8|nr:hypothetical protein [Mucilaginibacter gossypii]WPV02759.1 hypothetical protein SNE26_13305 [Mucilaginibacter gossypii]